MAIRVKPRAVVEPEFMKEYRDLATKFAAKKFEQMKSASPRARAGMIERNKTALARLNPIIHDVREAGKGVDFEISRLRAADYVRFFVKIHNGNKYMCGTTRPIIAETYMNENIGYERVSVKQDIRTDIGKYCVYVPADDILEGRTTGIHFVPDHDPYTPDRHWHHGANPRDRYDHFLDYVPNTCWGSIGEPVIDCMLSVHLSELFRMLWVYLARHDASSELIHFRGGRRV